MMTKKKTKSSEDPVEKKITTLIYVSVILLTLFSLYSGGEFLGLVTVIIFLYASYRLIRYSYEEIHYEKLFLYTIGIYFTLISITGLLFMFLGFNLSVINFLIFSLISTALIHKYTKGNNPAKTIFDKKRVFYVALALFLAFSIYLWPSLPSFTSPCTFGFDCTLHMEYMANIYTLESAVPPIQDWRYYPSGFHINGALLNHALEPDMACYSNLSYPFTAFMGAMIVAVMAGMLYDRVKNKKYVALFILVMLATVYPASALIGFGFWSNFFGVYYVVLFAWMLGDFIPNPKDKKILVILLLIVFGSIIAYQILTTLILIISFTIAALTLVKLPLAEKIKLALIFLVFVGLFYGIYTMEGYSRYLGYLTPISTYDYVADRLPPGIVVNERGSLHTKLEGSMIHISSTGLHTDEEYYAPGFKPLRLLKEGISLQKFSAYTEIGRYNIRGPSGNAIYYDIKWFGYLTLFLMLVGLIYSYAQRDYTLVFIEATIIHLFIFSYGLSSGDVNFYYYSKMMYLFIYPVTMYAIVGLEEIVSKISSLKKPVIVFIAILIIMISYSMNLYESENLGLIIGERRDLVVYDQYWPLLEFNRFARYWDMMWGLTGDTFGLAGWLEMNEISIPLLSHATILTEPTSDGVWLAADFEQHETGNEAAEGAWESEQNGFGYMIGRNYMSISPGEYEVIFNVKVDDNTIADGRKAVTIEVAKDNGLPVVVRDLYPKDFNEINVYQDFTLDLKATEALDDVEFRAHFDNGGATVTISQVTLTKTN